MKITINISWHFLEKQVDWLAFGAIPKAPVVQASAIRPDNSEIHGYVKEQKTTPGPTTPIGDVVLFVFVSTCWPKSAFPWQNDAPKRCRKVFPGCFLGRFPPWLVQPFPSLSIFLGAAGNLGKWWYFTHLKCSAFGLGGALPPKEDPRKIPSFTSHGSHCDLWRSTNHNQNSSWLAIS